MAVRYILGRAGSGKSHRVFEEIQRALLVNRGEHLLLLVPEQYTLQAERDLISTLGLPGIMGIEVLSFSRLAGRVFEEEGGSTRTLLSEQGKQMILRRLLDGLGPQLTIYRQAAVQTGFIEQLSRLIAGLKQQEIDPAELRRCAPGAREPVLGQKVEDVALLYQQFNLYLEDHYLDNEDYLNLLYEKIASSKLVQNARVWLDGFTTFSPQTLKILGRIMPMAAEVTICLTLDPVENARDRGIFRLSRHSLQGIDALARENQLDQEIIALGADRPRPCRDQALDHLERELYAYPPLVYAAATDSVEIFAASHPAGEVEYAAAQIVNLVRDRGWRWKDLAVVCNDMKTYGKLIKRIFSEYGIPLFMDQKHEIVNNPLIRLLLSSGEVIRRGYRYHDVFTLLKTGLTGINDDDMEQLENIVLKRGITGSAWKHPFDLAGDLPEARLEEWRSKLIGPLQKLEQEWGMQNRVDNFCRAHFEYLRDGGIKSRLLTWVAELEQAGYFEAQRENAQIWNIVLEIFDQMAEILGDQEVTLQEYLHILEAGCMAREVGIIPTTIDQLLCGSIQRTKSQDIQALLLLGANDGILPSLGEEEGLFSGGDKHILQEMGLELDWDESRRWEEERLLIYASLSKPMGYLGISYALADGEGRALRPSLLIDRLHRLLPQVKTRSEVIHQREIEMHHVGTPGSTFKYLVENLRQGQEGLPVDEFWSDAWAWYANKPEWRDKLSWIETGLCHRNQVDSIGSEQASWLFPQPMYTSISRIEQFVNCPFAHLVRYGLMPQERDIYEVAPPDIGELFHHSLTDFAQQLCDLGLDWSRLEPGQAEGIMDQVMDCLIPQHNHGIFTSSHRYRYQAQRLRRMIRRTVKVLTQHLQRGEFVPWGHEICFGPDSPLPALKIGLDAGDSMYLVGRIDRVDILATDSAKYIKVIDYKSGPKVLRLGDIYHGLSLQLVSYLQAVRQGYPDPAELKPGGIFYFGIDDPVVDSTERSLELIERERARHFKMSGIVLKDVEVVRKMDCLLGSVGSTDILPVAINSGGDFSKKSQALSEPEFEALLGHAEDLIRTAGTEIMQGKARIEPIKYRQKTACRYCQFDAICQFDRFLANNNYRVLPVIGDEQVTARLRGGDQR